MRSSTYRRLPAVALAMVASIMALAGIAPLEADAATTARGGYACGNNASGELDDGTTIGRPTPVANVGLAGVSIVSAGMWHSLALRSDGSVIAWGHNPSGELGDGTHADHSTPVRVVGLSNVRSISAGTAFSLAVRDDGAVFAWGNNSSGELGDGKAPADSAKPVRVHGLGPGSGVVAVSAGGSFALALESNGQVLAWGNNASGELGDGTAPTDHSTPVDVTGLGPGSGVIAVAAGGAQSLALESNGQVLAWGNNASGELGDGTAPNNQNQPVPVQGLGAGSGVVAIATGGSFGLALKSDGELMAWGNNASGELGNGNLPNDSSTPVRVSRISDAVAIAAGRAHALALTRSGSVLAWGDNTLGQVGDGSGSNANKPVTIRGIEGPVLGVFAGGDHSHVLVGSVSQPPSSGGGQGKGGGPSPTPTPTGGPHESPTPTPAPSSNPTPKPKPKPKPSASTSPSPSLAVTVSASPGPLASGPTGAGGGGSGAMIPVALSLLVAAGAGAFVISRKRVPRPLRRKADASRRADEEMWR